MKAFGVRLAAGAVTVLLGVIMAAQAQKDQQSDSESAWTENSIPPGKEATPIGSSPDMVSTDDWMHGASDEFATNPFAENDETNNAPASGVVLVQHTEDSSPSPPDTASQPNADFLDLGKSPNSHFALGSPVADEAPGTAASPTPMPLPEFAGGQAIESIHDATETNDASGPSLPFTMSAPTSESMTGAATQRPTMPAASGPTMSSVTIADSPSGSAGIDAAAASPNEFTNELRGSADQGNALRMGAVGAIVESHGGVESQSNQPAEQNLRLSGGQGISDPNAYEQNAPSPDAYGQATFGGFASEAEMSSTAMSNTAVDAQVQPSGSTPTLSFGGIRDSQTGQVSTLPQPTPGELNPNGVGMNDAGSPAIANANPSVRLLGQTQLGGDVALNNQSQTQTVAGFELNGGPNSANVTSNTPGYQAAENVVVGNNYALPGASQPVSPSAQSAMAQNLLGQQNYPTQQSAPGQSLSGTGLPRLPSAPQPAAGGSTYPNDNRSLFQSAGYKQRGDAREVPGNGTATLASPGDRSLDGPQSPSVVIHKRAPEEVKVGKTSSFVITVKNVGGSTAMGVRVQDQVPAGMQLEDAIPRPNPQFQPQLVWDLGDLEPQQERTITLQLTPLQEGELGSVARVSFQAAASVRTISTRPELKVVQRAPEKVPLGQQIEIELEVSNPGSGNATGVVLQEDVPDGFSHPQGKQLDNLIGTLTPNETRRQILRMRAVKAGIVENTIRVKGDDGLESTHTVAVEVIAPKLQVALSGPARRYLERQAKYELQIANVGTDEANNVEISVQLDRGFTFVSTDYEGQYDPTRHAVFWSLPSLPAGGSGSVPLVLLPVQEGNRLLRCQVVADMDVTATSESQVQVDSLAELNFSINDTADPVEVGGESTFEIRVANSGSRDDTNIHVQLQLPPGMQVIGNGDFQVNNQGSVAFTPKSLLPANEEVIYRVKTRGIAPGRHLVKAIVTSDQSNVPVTKEESIMVYADK